jgi:hypothetical protein
MFDQFNFDMLKALCEEMNRYDESPQQSLTMLNTHPEGDSGGTFTVQMFHKNVELPETQYSPAQFGGNPVAQREISCEHYRPTEDEDDYDTHYFTLVPENLKQVVASDGSFVYVQGEYRVVFKRKKYAAHDYYSQLY